MCTSTTGLDLETRPAAVRGPVECWDSSCASPSRHLSVSLDATAFQVFNKKFANCNY